MKKSIQTKRNKPSGSSYRVLYAKTGRKRRLHAATATVDSHVDLETDVPNMRIGRALLVIFVLHIVAVAAIYIHSNYMGGDNEPSTASTKVPAVVAAAVTPPEAKAPAVPKPVAPPTPDVAPASYRYIVVTGDTYRRIAQARNVDEQSLRALNSNRPIRAGVVLDLPAELSSRPVAVQYQQPIHRPEVAVVNGDRLPKAAKPFRAAERDSGPDVSNAPKAIVVKPAVKRPAPMSIKDSGTRYTIKSGDTLWRISNRFKVPRAAVLKLNGIQDPNKLYAGRTIKIPAK